VDSANHGKPRKDGGPSASKSDGLRGVMLARLASQQGKVCYAQRSRTIEPVFNRFKTVQGGGRFMRRGCGPAKPSGSCCAALTICSSSGAPPRPPPADRHQPPGAAAPPALSRWTTSLAPRAAPDDPRPTAAADRALVDAVRRRREALKNLGGARRSR
jgi:hypothetical protein